MTDSYRVSIRICDLARLCGIADSTLRRRWRSGAKTWEEISVTQKERREKKMEEERRVLEKPRPKATPEKAYTDSELWTIYKLFCKASDAKQRLAAFMGVPVDMAEDTYSRFRARAIKEGRI